MRFASSLRSLRAVALGALFSLGALAGTSRAAEAQPTVSVAYDGSCGPMLGCGLVQFSIVNGSGQTLELNSLTLVASSGSFAFTPASGQVTVGFSDDFGLFSAPGEVSNAGSQLFVDFAGGGALFTLSAGATGFLEFDLAATPQLATGAFTFAGQTVTGASITGTVAAASVVPEPSTYLLMATGLGALGVLARRRRTR
jgi:hypothetical protein